MKKFSEKSAFGNFYCKNPWRKSSFLCSDAIIDAEINKEVEQINTMLGLTRCLKVKEIILFVSQIKVICAVSTSLFL